MHAESDVYLFVVSIGASAFGGALAMASGIFIVPFLTRFEGVSILPSLASRAGRSNSFRYSK